MQICCKYNLVKNKRWECSECGKVFKKEEETIAIDECEEEVERRRNTILYLRNKIKEEKAQIDKILDKKIEICGRSGHLDLDGPMYGICKICGGF